MLRSHTRLKFIQKTESSSLINEPFLFTPPCRDLSHDVIQAVSVLQAGRVASGKAGIRLLTVLCMFSFLSVECFGVNFDPAGFPMSSSRGICSQVEACLTVFEPLAFCKAGGRDFDSEPQSFRSF